MADTEKITINLNVVDLGRIDFLVDEGFYSNRTDLIRTAIRNQLERHQDELKAGVVRKSMVIGVVHYGRQGLEKRRAAGEKVAASVLGMIVIDDDVSPELARDSIAALRVFGVLRASKAVREAIAERIR
jgi:Arc/MetJ-type ribon-helix-helix transcriptional regulator